MFSEKALDFLAENRLQNSREWYHEHKQEYRQHVVQPFIELVQALTPLMQRIDAAIDCTPRIDRTISRVYRDTRFSRDKSLYREVAWCTFMRSKKLYHGMPAFFFEISPDGIRYGCGYYAADPATLESIRREVLAGSKLFLQAKKAIESQQIFEQVAPRYKRTRYPEQSEQLRQWLDLRDFCLMHQSTDFGWLFSDRVAPDLEKAFEQIAPVYHFLLHCEVNK